MKVRRRGGAKLDITVLLFDMDTGKTFPSLHSVYKSQEARLAYGHNNNDLARCVLDRCKQDKGHQIVINASDTGRSQEKEYRPTMQTRGYSEKPMEFMFTDVRNYGDGVRDTRRKYKKIVDFKMTFNFAEEITFAKESSEPGKPEAEEATDEWLVDMDDEIIEWTRYLPLFGPFLMGSVGLGLIIYAMLRPKNPRRAASEEEEEEEERTSEAVRGTEHDVENPEEDGEC